MKIIICIFCLFIAGCNIGGEFDQLKVIDGKGRILLLKHNIGHTYFVQDISTPPETPNGEINKNLNNKLGLVGE